MASLVLGVSHFAKLSTIATRSSEARSDSAEYSARRIIFFGVFWSYLRGLGPSAMPPPG